MECPFCTNHCNTCVIMCPDKIHLLSIPLVTYMVSEKHPQHRPNASMHMLRQIIHPCCLDKASHLNIPFCERLPPSLSAHPSIAQPSGKRAKECERPLRVSFSLSLSLCLSISQPSSFRLPRLISKHRHSAVGVVCPSRPPSVF